MDQVQIEIRTMAHEVGCIKVPGQIAARDLATKIHSESPPPPGAFWKIVMDNQVLEDTILNLLQSPRVVTCVAEYPTDSDQRGAMQGLQDLISQGYSEQKLGWHDFMVWSALRTIKFDLNRTDF